jgi:hypothetical protein
VPNHFDHSPTAAGTSCIQDERREATSLRAIDTSPSFHIVTIEAHIFVAFLAYCLHVTLRARLKPLAPGLTPRAVLDKFAAIQMLDVHFPTTEFRAVAAASAQIEYLHPRTSADEG